MISGIGIDSVSICRISHLIEKFGDRFLAKVFTAEEIDEGSERLDAAQFFAARFAAREAFFKALGTGWGRGIALKDVSVASGEQGRPQLRFSPRAMRALEEKLVTRWHVSLTHEDNLAQAFVVLEGGRNE